MLPTYKETKMLDKIIKSLKPFQLILMERFRMNKQEGIEILLMLACGHLFEIFTPNQLAQTLGIDKNKLYRALKEWSIYQYRRMFSLMGCKMASQMIKEALEKSPATLSRLRITINVDDTVIERVGKLIRLTYSWFSGRCKKVVRGQNIIAITVKIGDRIIPLNIRPVGKQGRGNTSKPQIFREMLAEVIRLFEEEEIEIRQFPITFDSWYGSRELVELLKEEGFDQILIHAKSNYVFEIEGRRGKISSHKKEVELKEGWGSKGLEVCRKVALSPTFGEVVLLFFRESGKVKCLMGFGRKFRGCEMVSIWKQHHGIEQFWRRLKSELQIHKIRLLGREGVYGMIGIKLLGYLLMERISILTRLSFHQIKIRVRREVDVGFFFREHFHLCGAPQRL